MTDRSLEERLRRWHRDEAESASLPPTVGAALDQLADAGSASDGARVGRPVIVILVALLLLATVLGAMAIGSRIPGLDRSLDLDPRTLDPCLVLPGPGLPITGEPIRHSGSQIVGGEVCAYGWDDGNNVHLELRSARTGHDEAADIAARLFTANGGEGPTPLVVDEYSAWIGRTTWSSTSSESPCAAMAVSASDVFFVVWLACRDGLRFDGGAAQASRDALEEIGHAVIANLVALNEGRPPVFALDHDGRGIGSQ